MLLFHLESPTMAAWIAPPSRQGNKSVLLPPAALPPPCTYRIRYLQFTCFQFLPLPPPLPRCCHAAHMDSWLHASGYKTFSRWFWFLFKFLKTGNFRQIKDSTRVTLLVLASLTPFAFKNFMPLLQIINFLHQGIKMTVLKSDFKLCQNLWSHGN